MLPDILVSSPLVLLPLSRACHSFSLLHATTLRRMAATREASAPGLRQISEGGAVREPSERHRLFPIALHSITFGQPTWGDRGPSSENWQLHYELLHTYKDSQGSVNSSGAPFYGLRSRRFEHFLQLAMLSGGVRYILTQGNYVNALFSHNKQYRVLLHLHARETWLSCGRTSQSL